MSFTSFPESDLTRDRQQPFLHRYTERNVCLISELFCCNVIPYINKVLKPWASVMMSMTLVDWQLGGGVAEWRMYFIRSDSSTKLQVSTIICFFYVTQFFRLSSLYSTWKKEWIPLDVTFTLWYFNICWFTGSSCVFFCYPSQMCQSRYACFSVSPAVYTGPITATHS